MSSLGFAQLLFPRPIAAQTIAWSTTDWASSTALTFSNGNLTVNHGSGGGVQGRGNTGKGSGKWYWEVHIDSAGPGPEAGVVDGSVTLTTSSDIGGLAVGYAYLANNADDSSYTRNNGVSSSILGGTLDVGDTMCFALDMDTGKIWFGKNGVWINSGNPATGTNPVYTGLTGTMYPAYSTFGGNAFKYTARFKDTSFGYTVPTGFISLTP